nr:immunoglobulin light chain junction region [Macaca mulatta]
DYYCQVYDNNPNVLF